MSRVYITSVKLVNSHCVCTALRNYGCALPTASASHTYRVHDPATPLMCPTCVYTQICICTCACIYVYIYILNMYTYSNTYTYIYIYTQVCFKWVEVGALGSLDSICFTWFPFSPGFWPFGPLEALLRHATGVWKSKDQGSDESKPWSSISVAQ